MAAFDDLKIGCILIMEEENTSPLPLEHTAVSGTITGAVAAVTVTQRFGNPFKKPVELEYLFPLPHKAAIVDYEITIGSRTIRAELKEKEMARRAYQEAMQQGKRASLLEQRRPNLFSIQIGNVQPGETIVTRLIFEDRLTYTDGAYEFIFPMGITPRYHQPTLSEAGAKAVDAPVTLDENKVAPVEITLNVDAGVSVNNAASRTHPITLTKQDDRRFSLALDGRHIPNKDFVLRYEVATDAVRTATWNSADADAETVLMTILPPRLDISAEPAPREFVFVIDRSGSMSGGPMTQAKNALRACLRALGQNDTFYIQAFDDHHDWFDTNARKVTQDNVNAADAWLNSIDARGGTEILPAIDNALALPADKERQRYVVFLTDGAVSADDTAIGKIARQRGSARIFTFGIGPSVNRYLLDKMAELGRGRAEFIGAQDDIETTITRFQDRVSYPALLDVSLTWQNADSWDTYPETLPDIYIGSPLEIVTRLKRRGGVSLMVSGTIQGQRLSLTVPVPAAGGENPTLKRIHARARIEALLDKLFNDGDTEKIRQQIISLALEHRVVTPYTAFVAVDSEVTQGKDAPEKIRVSVPLPEGLQYEGFFGGKAAYVGAPVVASASLAALRFYRDGPPAAPRARGVRSLMSSLPRLTKDEDDITGMGEAEESGRPAPAAREPWLSGFVDDEDIGAALDAATSPQGISDLAKKALEAGSRTTAGFLNKLIGKEKDADTGSRLPQKQFLSGEEALKWLARTQNVDGSWANDAEMTAAALIAFVRAGHTTRAGNYRRQVTKAMQWLQASVRSAKAFAFYLVVRALKELHDASGDGDLPDISTLKLPEVKTEADRAARGETHILVPQSIKSLDDLRVVALMRGCENAKLEYSASAATQDLTQTWLAVGKP